jgi:hypothetical protein
MLTRCGDILKVIHLYMQRAASEQNVIDIVISISVYLMQGEPTFFFP